MGDVQIIPVKVSYSKYLAPCLDEGKGTFPVAKAFLEFIHQSQLFRKNLIGAISISF